MATPSGTAPTRSDVLADKAVLVSGGTQGVGAVIARAAALAGATVAVCGCRREIDEENGITHPCASD